jgi:hypothetical protein
VHSSPRIMMVAVPTLPAVAEVRAARLFAYRVQVLAPQQRLGSRRSQPAPGSRTLSHSGRRR